MQKTGKNVVKIGITLLLVVLLAAIRAYENELFYDPFADYFTNDYLNLPFPNFDFWPLILSLAFRYSLNTIVSLAIIFVLFSDVNLIKFSAFLYIVFFVLLIIAFALLITYSDQSNNFALFYVRRFLIQPLFLLLFVPAFYYQSRTAKK